MKASLLEIVMASPCFISRAYSSELFAVCDAVWRLITVATYVLIYSEIETCSLRQIFIAVLYHVWYAAFVLQVKAYYTIWAVPEPNSLISNVGVQTSWNAKLNYGKMSCVSKIKAW